MPAYCKALKSAHVCLLMIVGDLSGVQANLPNGDDITLKFDDLTLAEADLIKIVGRLFVGVAVVAPDSLCRVYKGEGGEA